MLATPHQDSDQTVAGKIMKKKARHGDLPRELVQTYRSIVRKVQFSKLFFLNDAGRFKACVIRHTASSGRRIIQMCVLSYLEITNL
jgi:hypothetical protein